MESEPAHILVVDDDTRLRDLLKQFLSDNGYRVTTAESAEAAKDYQRSMAFDLIVLDRMMPGQDGLSFARELRDLQPVPILMLTAMGEVKDRIDGLEVGVDDYLPKPFEPRELLLRLQTILRRAQPTGETADAPAPSEVTLGDFCFEPERALLTGADGVVKLTSAEASLLKALALRPGEVMSRIQLTEECDIEGGERSVDVQVTRLRRKVEPDPKTPRYLQTVRGRGYVLRPD
ncbi:MAG TPA: DNA-binding response regulator [Rhodospirillaceae bacterium]|nr:DNA-binding response regulator [Rhodospirillaceae bacterium]HAT35935.1 DNA-binding response regulator [Rhodospirillaceae bacterium]